MEKNRTNINLNPFNYQDFQQLQPMIIPWIKKCTLIIFRIANIFLNQYLHI